MRWHHHAGLETEAIAMRGRNSRASTWISGRQYAIAVVETVVTFECGRLGHTYKIDWSKKPLTKRMGPAGCRMMAGWWSREKGGCIGECPKCILEAKKTEGFMKIDEEISRIGSVLRNRGVDVDKMLQRHKEDKSKSEVVLKDLVGALYDGLAYGNWPQ